MKKDLKISTVAIVYVLCAAVSAAHGASSVRTLGGAGTYSSAAAASGTSTSSATARGGSVRVTPTVNRVSSGTVNNSASAGVTTTRVATTPRLSIGKYLGGGTVVSGGSSIKPQNPGTSGGSSSGGVDPSVAAALRSDVDQLRRDVDTLHDADDALSDKLQNKQNSLLPKADGFVLIDDTTNEISVDVENLKDAIGTVAGKDGREVEIGSDDEYLQWRYVGDTAWQNLIAKSALVGPQGPKGEPGDGADVDLTPYAKTADVESALNTKANAADLAAKADVSALDDYAKAATLGDYAKIVDMNAAITNAITTSLANYAKIADLAPYAKTADLAGYATTDQLAQKANASDLAAKANTTDVYTKTEVDEKVANVVAGDMSEALKSYAKTADVNASLAGKANTTDLDAYAKTTDVSNALNAKADKSDLTGLATVADLESKADKSELTGLAKSADVNLALANKADKSVTDALTTALADKANRSELDAYAKTSDLSGYAKTADVNEALAGKANSSELDAKADKATTLAGYGITDSMTAEQIAAAIDEAKVAGSVDLTAYYKKGETDELLNAKQNALTAEQLAAANSGITAGDVTTYNEYATQIAANATAATDAANAAQNAQTTANNAAAAVASKLSGPADSGTYLLTVNGNSKVWTSVQIIDKDGNPITITE
mgnify:CR=1 FL=1